MKTSLILTSIILSLNIFYPLKQTNAQILYRPQRTIPGVSSDCLNYMMMEGGQYVCLSYSQGSTTTPPMPSAPPVPPTTSTPEIPPKTDDQNSLPVGVQTMPTEINSVNETQTMPPSETIAPSQQNITPSTPPVNLLN